MPDALATLEADRSKLPVEFPRLGDLRPGSTTAVVRRRGQPSRHGAKPDDPGHDPPFRPGRRVAGKTVTETFPNPTALRKAQQEVTGFHRLRKLSEDLAGINVDRPGRSTAAAIHRKIAREIDQLLGRIFTQRRHSGRTGLEAVESALRAALQRAGATALSELPRYEAPAPDRGPLPGPCGHHARHRGLRSKPVLTVVGPA